MQVLRLEMALPVRALPGAKARSREAGAKPRERRHRYDGCSSDGSESDAPNQPSSESDEEAECGVLV